LLIGSVKILDFQKKIISTTAKPREVNISKGINKIKNVIIIMQENRSFDHYFGTFPGADGIPMIKGYSTVCIPDTQAGRCIKPFHTSRDLLIGGPHGSLPHIKDVNGGKMNGFINTNREIGATIAPYDVVSYYDDREIPNYWTYARKFVLQDRMFEPIASSSLPAHVFMVSGWSAKCEPHKPLSCKSEIDTPENYAWTDLTYMLQKKGISWKYYINGAPKGVHGDSLEPDCEDSNEIMCVEKQASVDKPGTWNPLPGFDTVIENRQLHNIQDASNFYTDAKNGNLPSVSWIIPSARYSEHPPALTSPGQTYVTGLVNSIMKSPQWNSSAIFISWDDWGGFYDHVVPPQIADQLGYGMRVPGLMISPYAKKGFIDHQTLSFDAYLQFIEDIFLDGQRINPKTDGRPDSRPVVRENVPKLGDLAQEFDFNQPPRPPLILSPNP
ncbi:MAG: alkaline phosphatase family protein, partial [Thermosynechococcaceae cyanobacterium]